MRLNWYKDRTDGIWTIDIDADAVLVFEVDWGGRFTGVTGVTPQTPVAEGGTASVVVLSFDDVGMKFKVTGSGAKVAFRVAFGTPAQTDDVTLRFRLGEG